MDLCNWGPVGTPEQIAEWLRTFADAGVDHFICRFGALDQFGQVERFAREVLPLFSRRESEVSAHGREPSSLLKDAALVVDVCMSVEADDVVTIICDDEHAEQADAVAEVVVERGGWPVVMNNEHQVRRGARRRALPDGPAAQPPPGDGGLRRGHHHHQPRVGQPLRPRHGRQGDVRGQRQDRLGRARDGLLGPHRRRPPRRHRPRQARDGRRSRARSTSASRRRPAPTSTVSIEGRPALEVTPIKHRGQMMGPVPLWAEVAFAAVEDYTNGAAIVDGVMLGIGLDGQVKRPSTWAMEGGRCVSIEGGDEARAPARGDRRRRERRQCIGEFAFGVSDKAPYGTPSEKGRVGTVHMALGDNHNAYPGGQNVSVLHLDGVFLNATMQIVDDGTYILRDGEWAL